MINTVTPMASTDLMDTLKQITETQKSMENFGAAKAGGTQAADKAPSFGDMLSNLVSSVDKTSKTAQANTQDLLTGKSQNIHQAMLSMQEASVAFNMMTEVRNKLVSAFQELMRMQI